MINQQLHEYFQMLVFLDQNLNQQNKNQEEFEQRGAVHLPNVKILKLIHILLRYF